MLIGDDRLNLDAGGVHIVVLSEWFSVMALLLQGRGAIYTVVSTLIYRPQCSLPSMLRSITSLMTHSSTVVM